MGGGGGGLGVTAAARRAILPTSARIFYFVVINCSRRYCKFNTSWRVSVGKGTHNCGARHVACTVVGECLTYLNTRFAADQGTVVGERINQHILFIANERSGRVMVKYCNPPNMVLYVGIFRSKRSTTMRR